MSWFFSVRLNQDEKKAWLIHGIVDWITVFMLVLYKMFLFFILQRLFPNSSEFRKVLEIQENSRTGRKKLESEGMFFGITLTLGYTMSFAGSFQGNLTALPIWTWGRSGKWAHVWQTILPRVVCSTTIFFWMLLLQLRKKRWKDMFYLGRSFITFFSCVPG